MISNKTALIVSLMMGTVALTVDVNAAVERKRSDSQVIPASSIQRLQFMNISQTDLTYMGSDDADQFIIEFVRTAKAGDIAECEELLNEISLDVSTRDAVAEIRLSHPDKNVKGLFARIFRQKEWRVTMKVTGPRAVDIGVDAQFSSVRTEKTGGEIDLDISFSSADSRSHTGYFKASGSFSEIDARDLDGGFGVSIDFGNVNLTLDRLSENSSARSNFGSVEIRVPQDTGAEFHITKSLGSANFYLSGDVEVLGEKGSTRILNNGGPQVNLETEFGSITVRNNLGGASASRTRRFDRSAVMPLERKAWWRYSSGERTSTLTVRNIWFRDNRRMATLRFEGHGERPFYTIDVCETSEGLMIARIDGAFFGKDLSGLSFDPPRLWLPYGDSDDAVSGDSLLGSATVITGYSEEDSVSAVRKDAVHYSLETDGSPFTRLSLAPGVGFTAFGEDLTLVEYNLDGVASRSVTEARPKEETPPPPPPFEKGEIVSLSFSGLHYLPESEVEELFTIKKGGYYTRQDISKEIDKLPEKSRFISGASYTIDTQGKLRVHIYETKLYSWDWDADGSFTRVAGLGFGPCLTLKSLVGPFSELSGSAQYHWGNKDWTFAADINKHFFTTNRLTFGASYRLDYETNMDWAIPKHDAYCNAFFLGLDTTNYYRIEGSTGYITQRFGRMLELRGEYFEEDYESVKKHTNWSLFNARHKKEDNPPLSPDALGSSTGVRFIADIDKTVSVFKTSIRLSAERSYDRKANSLPGYTRYFADAVWSSRIPYRNHITIRTAGGWSDDLLPEQRAFRLGGLNTLRGFDFGAIPEPPAGMDGFDYHGGGNKMLLANIDYFLGSSDEFSMVVFGDVGGVWRKGEDVELRDLKRDLGVGLVFGGDVFPLENRHSDELLSGLRINWAVPVGPEKHVSHWTVNFVRAY